MTVTSTTSSSLATRVSQEVDDMITAPMASSSPATRIPQKVVGVIIAHLIHDDNSLLACSLTSRSWYTAAVPHLHRTLSIKTTWPEPLHGASKFGWLPFVTRLFIFERGNGGGSFLSSYRFDHRTQLEFSGLTNVRELQIAGLDIPSSFPTILQCFRQFSPTLCSLTLNEPKGTNRQIVFFIGLFQHLEDLNLGSPNYMQEKPGDGLTLVPPFVPPLRGCLTAANVNGDLSKTMVDLFGGLRFRHMDLLNSGTQILVYACANALEVLCLSVTDICGEESWSKHTRVLANSLTGGLSHRDLDLSRNGSLQKIQITAHSLISALSNLAPETVPSTLRAMISTINSHTFSDVVVVYGQDDFYNVAYSKRTCRQLYDEDSWYREQFDVLREMYKARDFRLVIQALCVSDISVRELERRVAVEEVVGGLPPRLEVNYTLAAR